MKYHFPKNTRKKVKKETLLELEKLHNSISEISDRVIIESFDKLPLLHELHELKVRSFDIGMENGNDYYFASYDLWRELYIEHNWKEIKDYGISPENDDQHINIILEGFDEEIYKHYSAFEKLIDGTIYRQTLQIDHFILEEYDVWSHRAYIVSKRIKNFKEASFNLSLLERYTEIYDYEALLILMGISPSDIHPVDMHIWRMSTEWFNNKYCHEIEEKNIKVSYQDFDEWRWIQREFKIQKKRPIRKLKDLAGLTFTLDIEDIEVAQESMFQRNIYSINTQEFINWALKLGYVEEGISYSRDEGEAPFEREFSELLYKELKDRHLITGDYNEKWQWQSHNNSLNYFIRLLWKNTLPRKWYARFPNKTRGPNWDLEKGVMHYFFYKEITLIRKMRSNGVVDREVDIENVVNALLTQAKDPEGMKYL